MLLKSLLPLLGRIDALTCAVPLLGAPLVRSKSHAVALLAFSLPYLGGKRCHSVAELKEEWFGFLGRLGLSPELVREEEREFEWTMRECPYGFAAPEQIGVCDACMELDRVYTRLLGGELEIVTMIPAGSPQCRCITRLC